MNVSHKKITLNYRNFFFKIFFLYIFFTNIAFSEGTKIGSITEINGEVIAITEEGDERILDIYDEIYLKSLPRDSARGNIFLSQFVGKIKKS